MENVVLRSMVEYPKEIESFFKIFNQRLFCAFSQVLLKEILLLKESNALSLESLLSRIPSNLQESEKFLNFLSAEINPNYLHFAPLLLENVKLKRQKQIAEKLLRATEEKTLLDLDYLQKELEITQTTPLKNLKEWADFYANKPKSRIYPLGIPFLDDYLRGGIELAQLVLISGDPEAGKTRLCLQILENLSKREKVCFFCFEFTAESYVRGRMEAGGEYFENFYIINDGYDIAEVANNIRSLYKEGVKFFLIDSQMRLTAPNGRNMEEEQTRKFSTLAKLCHSLGIVVFLIIQTSKADRDNPTGSKKGGHEASIILRLERIKPEKDDILQKGNEYDESARMFYIRKNKQTGKHPKEKIFFDTQTLRFKRYKEQVDVVYEVSQEEIKAISAPVI